MIRLVKSTFYNEADTKKKLVDFIRGAKTLSMGSESRKFEEGFAKKQGRKYAVFVNSGSTANLLLLQALVNLGRLKRGDRVGISAITWSTNVMPVIQLGLKPVAIDCELPTLNVSTGTLKERIGKLDALFLTNALGLCGDIKGIRDFCRKYRVLFVEDNCESLGSKIHGTLLGNFGLAATFSFFVGHHFSTIEGGMIVTDDKELYHAILMARAHGWHRSLPPDKRNKLMRKHGVDDFFGLYTFYELAYNVRPTDIHGFLGVVQLKYWDEIVAERQRNFLSLKKLINGNNDFIPLNTEHMDTVSNFAIPIICKDKQTYLRYRDLFQRHDVEIRPVITGNITRQPFYRKYVKRPEECRNANFIHEHAFYFGNNPDLTKDELKLLHLLVKGEKKRVIKKLKGDR